ncbi:hypothetical protein SAM40697_4601 [Streptomyces ambofaciens]|uniref:Uncharacterized protein n=1 Tax=Streptomyces ambofaciens TaxID=1889 RepID=A0ABN4PDC0_STRAM|nr:hypothetical protein SAM40697_4601 [Streptomyces ambofaciens]
MHASGQEVCSSRELVAALPRTIWHAAGMAAEPTDTTVVWHHRSASGGESPLEYCSFSAMNPRHSMS